jgi:DeoR family transcriptional regulator, suf operon transcriptional repressor
LSIFMIIIINIDFNKEHWYTIFRIYMTGTRDLVLQTLLTQPRSTVNDLADKVGISPISIRHHIANLEAEGLISSEDERHGVGRPRQLFSLTDIGIEQFPTRYVRLTIRLLEHLKETMPEAMISKLFSQMAEDLARDISVGTEMKNLTMKERLNLVKELLKREGFNIEWEQLEDGYEITEASCPYYYIGQNHPEVCTVDQILISKVLSVPTEKVKCILNGDSNCTYVVSNALEP